MAKILLAHHYWKDGKNATWFPIKFPIQEIEVDLKSKYDYLQAEKPPYLTLENVTVFLAYHPSKDIFGRDIVPISFAFVKNCRNPEVVAKIILPQLQKSSVDQAELNVNIPIGTTNPLANFLSPKKLCLVAALVLILFICATLISKNPDDKQITQQNSTELTDNKRNSSAQKTNNPTVLANNNVIRNEEKKALDDQLKQKSVSNAVNNTKNDVNDVNNLPNEQNNNEISRIEKVCSDQSLQENFFGCPQHYLKEEFCPKFKANKKSYQNQSEAYNLFIKFAKDNPRCEQWRKSDHNEPKSFYKQSLNDDLKFFINKIFLNKK